MMLESLRVLMMVFGYPKYRIMFVFAVDKTAKTNNPSNPENVE